MVRQAGDLVEKLKKKHENPYEALECEKQSLPNSDSFESGAANLDVTSYAQISEANAELARRGAKLSLEDMDSENFTLIAEAFTENNHNAIPSTSYSESEINEIAVAHGTQNTELFDASIGEFIDSISVADKNVPSPSEILKNLCLSKDEDYNIGMLEDPENVNSYDLCKELNEFR